MKYGAEGARYWPFWGKWNLCLENTPNQIQFQSSAISIETADDQ